MKDGESLKDYFSKIMEIFNHMKTLGEIFTSQRIVEKKFISVTEKFNSIVTVLENTKDLTKLTVEELMGSIT